jgi:GPI mannosyltransferase 3
LFAKSKGISQVTSGGSPWEGVYILLLVGFFLRVVFSLISDNIHVPDELFQYLEQAHRLVFGYGLVPWEFRFGVRSWITPGITSVCLYLLKAIHLDQPAIYIPTVKIFFSLISTSLVFSAYYIGKNLASKNAGKLAALCTCIWYELIYFAPRPLTDVLSTYALVGALACAVAPSDKRKPKLFGILLALSAAIRIQNLLPATVIVLFVLFKWPAKEWLKSCAAFLLMVFLAGFIDFLTWGKFFVSYYNYYYFNITQGVLKSFGEDNLLKHFAGLTICSAGILAIFAILSLFKVRKVWLPFSCATVIVIMYLFLPHREYRYVFAVIPLLLVSGTISLEEIVSSKFSLRESTWAYRITIIVFAGVSILGVLNDLPLEKKIYRTTPLFRKQDSLLAYRYLSERTGVEGILDATRPWWRTGGYYYLHRDIPVYFPEQLQPNNPDVLRYVSHILCRTSSPEVEGFKMVAAMGNIEIREQTHPPTQYEKIVGYGRNVLMPGIDDRFDQSDQK